MEEACAVQFYCCPRCNGLFTNTQDLLKHKSSCDGTAQNSNATLFACAKSAFCDTNSKPLVRNQSEIKQEPIEISIGNVASVVSPMAKEEPFIKKGLSLEDHDYISARDQSPVDDNGTVTETEDLDHLKEPSNTPDEKPLPSTKKRSKKTLISKSSKSHITSKKDIFHSTLATREKRQRKPTLKALLLEEDNKMTQNKAKLSVSKEQKEELIQTDSLPVEKVGDDNDDARNLDLDKSPLETSGDQTVTVLMKRSRRRGKSKHSQSMETNRLEGPSQKKVKHSPIANALDADDQGLKSTRGRKCHDSGSEMDDLFAKKKPCPQKSQAEKLIEKRALIQKYKEYATMKKTPHGSEQALVYKCPDCPKETTHVGFFNRHMIGCHPPPIEEGGSCRAWKCNECDFITPNKSRLVQHRYKHRKNLMCDVCSMCFGLRRDLETHKWVHQEQNPHKCPDCDYSTRFPGAFREHLRKHTGKLLKCSADGCDFTTAYDWALRCHKNSKHQQVRVYQCKLCSYETKTRSCLVRHHKAHLGMREYQCSLCSHKAVSKHEIVRHMRRHTKEKMYFCDRCDFSTSYSSGLKIHLMQHLGMKPWQCSLCGFNSITKQRVHQHQSTRHPSLNGEVVNLGLKMHIDMSRYKRKAASCYTVKTVEELEEEVGDYQPMIVMATPEGTVANEVMVETEFPEEPSSTEQQVQVTEKEKSPVEVLTWHIEEKNSTKFQIQDVDDEESTIIMHHAPSDNQAQGEGTEILQLIMDGQVLDSKMVQTVDNVVHIVETTTENKC